MTRPARLTLTPLEDRLTPAGFGNTWMDTNLTVSFAPDGTKVDGVKSELFRTLGKRMTDDEWQGAIKSAFQSWIVPANLNVAFVADDGRAFGSAGPVQGSPHVGDIRISARPLSDNVVAISNPFDLISTWAGEIVINSNKTFDNDGSAGTYDLRTVLLQEVGHVLGVDNSADPNSVMYENYCAPRTGLSAGDIASVTALYGARTPDRFEGNNGNATLVSSSWMNYIQNATQLAGTDGTQGSQPYVASGDITTGADVDTYAFLMPANRTNPTVVVQTGGLSSARLQVSVVYQLNNEPGNVSHLLTATSTPNANGNYVIPITPPADATWYYVKIEAAPGAGAFGVGSYRLAMGNGLTAIPQSQYTTKISTLTGTVTESSDWTAGKPANDTVATATKLGNSRSTPDQRWDYSGTATLGSTADVDVYQVQSKAKAGQVMLVHVGTAEGGVRARIQVKDAKGKNVPFEVLLQNKDATIIQVQGIQKSSTYYVSVRAADEAAWAGAESYQIGIDFRDDAVTLDTFASGTLTETAPQLARALEVTRSQMFRFQITATDTVDTVDTAARFTVFDATGTAVFTMVAKTGQTVIGDVLLPPGTYTTVIAGATIDGSPLKGLQIDARYMTLTDPIGPMLADDYASVAPPGTASGTTTQAPASATDTGFFWLAPATNGSGFLAPTDLYSSPWW